VSVLLAGLLAMNYFEPVAKALEGFDRSSASWSQRSDFLALVGLFALFVFLLRLMTDRLAPTYMPVQSLAYEIGRWSLGLMTGYLTMAILLAALHTAPFPRWVTTQGVQEFIPGFRAERRNFFNVAAPDRQWLGFVQYVSRRSLPRGRVFDGPRFPAGDYEIDYWPSFPIRYASRREDIAGGPIRLGPAGTSEGGGLRQIEPSGGSGGTQF
jgi:hypothetical protein